MIDERPHRSAAPTGRVEHQVHRNRRRLEVLEQGDEPGAASYSGVFTLPPLLSGEGRARLGAILAETVKLVEAGRLRPRLDARRFGLDEAADAHAAMMDKSADGKLVVSIRDD